MVDPRGRVDGSLTPVALPATVSTDDSDGRPGGLAAALSVRRNAAIGAASGLAVAALAYVARVLELFGPAPTRGSPVLFFGLALVLATSVAVLVAVALSAASAVRAARRPPE